MEIPTQRTQSSQSQNPRFACGSTGKTRQQPGSAFSARSACNSIGRLAAVRTSVVRMLRVVGEFASSHGGGSKEVGTGEDAVRQHRRVLHIVPGGVRVGNRLNASAPQKQKARGGLVSAPRHRNRQGKTYSFGMPRRASLTRSLRPMTSRLLRFLMAISASLRWGISTKP